jgi:hypothetical protein
MPPNLAAPDGGERRMRIEKREDLDWLPVDDGVLVQLNSENSTPRAQKSQKRQRAAKGRLKYL